MTTEDERLLRALCAPTVTTAEATGLFGVDALALAVEKPSRNPAPAPARQLCECGTDAAIADAGRTRDGTL